MKKFLAVFILINLLLSSYYIDLWENANTTSRALPVITYYESGSFRIDRYHELTCDKALINQHYYTDKAPLPTFVVLPFFGLLKKMGLIEQNEEGNLYGRHIYALGGIIVGSIPFVVILVLGLMLAKNSEFISPPLLATLPYYGSFIFVFTGTFFAHIFSGILVLLSYIFLRKHRYWLSGCFAGAAFLSEYNLAVFFLIWGILMIFQGNIKPLLRFGMGVLPSLIFIMIYNYIFTGSPFTMLYKFHTFDQLHQNYGFSWPGWQSIWGLSFSWYKGIFFYAPFLLTALIVVLNKLPKIGYRNLWKNYIVIPSIFYFLFIASYFGWWGGWTHGPRLLLAMAVLLIYGGIEILVKYRYNRTLFWIFVAIGLAINFAAKATVVYSVPTGEKNPIFGYLIPKLFSGELNSNNLLSISFNISSFYSFMLFIGLFLISMIIFHFFYKKWVTQ